MKILCPECGFQPFDRDRCTVNLADPAITWDCVCDTTTAHTSVDGIVVALACAGAAISETLPDGLERECRAFAVALEDSFLDELWAAIEASQRP